MFYSYFKCFFPVIITNEGNDCQSFNLVLYEWNLGVKLESLGQLRKEWWTQMDRITSEESSEGRQLSTFSQVMYLNAILRNLYLSVSIFFILHVQL